jgi:hypothetical protein
MSRKLKIRNKSGFGDQIDWGGVDDDIIIMHHGNIVVVEEGSSSNIRHQASDIEREKGVCTVET